MSILRRILKNPETIPTKLTRFLKKFKSLEYSKDYPKEINKNTLIFNSIQDPEIIQEADKILNKEYEIFNQIYKIETIDWHKDYANNYIFPLKRFNLDKNGTDKKIPWELNRFQHLTTLAIAYHQTKEEKYFQEIELQINDWIAKNPFGKGINWSTPMECAVRAINLIQIYFLTEKKLDLLSLIYNHGTFIKDNLEWSPAKENHYLTDILGLFFIGLFFNKQDWIDFSKAELEKEIMNQVSEDGVDYEASINYHRLVTEIFLLTLIIGKKNNIEFSTKYKDRVENMCEFIMYYTPDSGNAPSFGDTDNSRILDIWNKNINDHRDILAVASIIFQRKDFKSKSKYHKRLSLIINEEEFLRLEAKKVPLKSKAFTDYYIIRDKKVFLMIHCGSIGRNNFGGHGHNDQLSFVFSYEDQDYIIDPGTYCYTSNYELRHRFRSSKAHNCLIVNNEEQNKINQNTPFNMDLKFQSQCLHFDEKSFLGILKYKDLQITRKIIYNNNQIIIEDSTNQDANLKLNFFINESKEIKFTAEEPKKIQTKISKNYGHITDFQATQIKEFGNTLRTIITIPK